jgi:hypothetical protein
VCSNISASLANLGNDLIVILPVIFFLTLAFYEIAVWTLFKLLENFKTLISKQ